MSGIQSTFSSTFPLGYPTFFVINKIIIFVRSAHSHIHITLYFGYICFVEVDTCQFVLNLNLYYVFLMEYFYPLEIHVGLHCFYSPYNIKVITSPYTRLLVIVQFNLFILYHAINHKGN